LLVDARDSETTIGALGLACALAIVLSACAALPAAGRVAGEGIAFGAAWLALSGSTAFVIGPCLFLAGRLGAIGYRGVRPALLGACWAVFPLSLLGSVLKLETNHRPLGAATYSVLALFVLVAAVFVAARIEDAAERDRDGIGAKLRLGALAVAFLSTGSGAFQVLRNPEVRAGALDGLSLVAATALGLFVATKVPPRSTFRHAVPLWVLVVVSGFVATTVHVDAISRVAPVLGGPFAWL
jgi:hypothetical protein